MRRFVFLAALAFAAFGSYVAWRALDHSPIESVSRANAIPPEAAPLCPWREPKRDMEVFFPQATSYQAEIRILSGLRTELAQQLHRPATGDENALRLNRIYHGTTPLGAILVRRVKGENGAIELVLAVDNDGAVQGLRLQRLREPETTAKTLEDTNWLASFIGKRANDAWKIGEDVPTVAASVQPSAQAIADAVRSLLVLNVAAEHASTPSLADAHHH